MTNSLDFSIIIKGNENAAREAFNRGDYLQAFLLIHTLIESLLRFPEIAIEILKTIKPPSGLMICGDIKYNHNG